jgi:ABC-type dipeptide/oligopeptide/nickel transport system permease subunit
VTYIEAASDVGAGPEPASPSFRLLRRLMRRPVAVAAIFLILVIYLAGILAPVLAPYDFNKTDFDSRFAGASSEHLLGTDRLGRDVLSRLIWSARTTVIISVATVVSGGLVLGVTLGLLSGYLGGRTDSIIMRIADATASVPTILLLLILNATLLERTTALFRDIEDLTGVGGMVRAGFANYFLLFGSLSLFSWVGLSRLVRSQVLALREVDYVLASRAMGASTARILFRHLLPNMTNLLVVAITLSLGAAAAAEVGLTVLGIGVHSPHASFGVMVSDYAGPSNIRTHFTLVLYPALVIGGLLFAFNLLGDALTDILSPRRR